MSALGEKRTLSLTTMTAMRVHVLAVTTFGLAAAGAAGAQLAERPRTAATVFCSRLLLTEPGVGYKLSVGYAAEAVISTRLRRLHAR